MIHSSVCNEPLKHTAENPLDNVNIVTLVDASGP